MKTFSFQLLNLNHKANRWQSDDTVADVAEGITPSLLNTLPYLRGTDVSFLNYHPFKRIICWLCCTLNINVSWPCYSFIKIRKQNTSLNLTLKSKWLLLSYLNLIQTMEPYVPFFKDLFMRNLLRISFAIWSNSGITDGLRIFFVLIRMQKKQKKPKTYHSTITFSQPTSESTLKAYIAMQSCQWCF